MGTALIQFSTFIGPAATYFDGQHVAIDSVFWKPSGSFYGCLGNFYWAKIERSAGIFPIYRLPLLIESYLENDSAAEVLCSKLSCAELFGIASGFVIKCLHPAIVLTRCSFWGYTVNQVLLRLIWSFASTLGIFTSLCTFLILNVVE